MVSPEIVSALQEILAGTASDALESQHLEFKRDQRDGPKATLRDLALAAVCFANSSGGTIVLGVADAASGVAAFTGTALDEQKLRHQLWELTDPHLVVDVQRLGFGGVDLLVVRVPESPEVHSTQGKAPRRIGTSCHDMTPVEQLRLREDKQGVDWSGQPSRRPAADVWPDAIVIARRLLGRHRDPSRQSMVRWADDDLLRALGALRSDGRLSNAGELLFCDAPEGNDRLVYLYRRTPGGEPADILRTGAPLVAAFQEVLRPIEARRLLTPVSLARGQQIHIEDFPTGAIREALSNAFVHRDYHLDMPIHIEHSPQVLEVISPGPLVAGVTPENILTHESKPRNPTLARAARMLGLAEEVGVGVDRMYREMLLLGKEPPVITSSVDSVRVTLVGGAPNTRIPYYLSELPEEEREDVDTLLVLFRLCSQRTVDAIDLAAVLQKPPTSAQAVLDRLSQESVGMLEPTRGTARRSHPKYRLRAEAMAQLGTAVRYNRRLLDELDRKVLTHVQEYGRISNKTVRNLVDVDVYRAADILADLVERGILVKISAASRGPSVAYGPGPKFPHRRRGGRS